MAKDIKFNIKLNIDGKNVVAQVSENVKELQRNLTAARTSGQRLSATLIKFNQLAQVCTNASGALNTLKGAMDGYVSKANASTTAQTKLVTVMRQRMNATDADTAAINKAVAAQTQLGIVSGTVQKSGLQQLATFASQRQTLETLLPAMNNLLAQQKGLNATSEDAVGVANLMGKALQGNVGALTRVGVTLTDHQKELIKTGDEYTKAKTLAEAITDNVGNMNAELAKTDAGQVKKAQMAFASIEVQIGKVLSPLQGMMTQLAQVGLALSGMGQLYAAVSGLAGALKLTAAVSSVWHARTVMSTAVTNLFSAALNGASVGATTLKFALRGLMSATIIGAALTGVSVGLEKLISYFTSAGDASQQFKQEVNDTSRSLEQQRDQALAPTLAKYQELQTKWKALKSGHEKNEFLKANKTAFEQLGVSIDSVGKAESYFVSNTKAVQDAMYARAEAAAAASMAEEEMRKALEAESKVNHDRLMDKDSYKKQHHTGKTGQDAAIDALVDSGAIGGVSKRTLRDTAERDKHRNAAKAYSNRAAAATAKATAGLKPYQGSNGTASQPTGTRGTAGSGNTTKAEKPAELGSLDWYEQKMQELRKQIYATNNEQTAQGLQAQYEDLEQKSKALKVNIGLEGPDTKAVKTYMEQLQDKLTAAQKDMDNATTIEARVAASAKIDEIQAEIDKATNGELSIKAEVEPSYIVKGSTADKRQSYQNAQNKASRVQQDYEIGLIGKDEAESQIKEINQELAALGGNLKPIKIEVDSGGFEKAMGRIKDAWSGVQGIGDGIESISNALKGNEDAWTAISSVINGFLSIAEGIKTVVTIVNALTGATQAQTAAKAAEASATTADTAATTANTVAAAANTAAKSGEAVANATASGAKLAYPANLIAIATGVAAVVAALAIVGSFATGGVVGGTSFSGDKLTARVNSGEMILTKSQQARLFAIANGQTSVNMPEKVTPNLTLSLPKSGSEGSDKVEFVLKGDTAVAQISNNSRLMKKIGKKFAL